jgi:anti-anti-sigma regulatory factor
MAAEIDGLIQRLDGGGHCVTVYDRRFLLAPAFGRWLRVAAAAEVVIDLERIDLVDQELLRTLLRLRRTVAPRGARLVLVCRPGDLRILELAHFGRAFRLSPSRAEALRGLDASPAPASAG